MNKHLHIVCFDVPYPVSHGGFFDLYYKVIALHKAGINIHLHCFVHRRKEQPILDQYCTEVHYYPRITGWRGFSFRTPYMVHSRRNRVLTERLLKDTYPILLEGLHCSGIIDDERFNGRQILLRAGNVETHYYRALARSALPGRNKLYYSWESILLRKWEEKAAARTKILAVAPNDELCFRKKFSAKDCTTLPVFVPFTSVRSEQGIGNYCLYHGNLSIAENVKAASFLVNKVFNDIPFPLVIAGKSPPEKLLNRLQGIKNISLVSDPADDKMNELIRNAQIHIIPSFNTTGIKIKLLNVLFNGRHCVLNKEAVEGTGLEAACHQGNTAAALKSLVAQLFHLPFGEEEIRLRQRLLVPLYDNSVNAEKLIQRIRWHYP